MKIVQIPKKTKGEYRTIYIPSAEEKYKYRKIIPHVENTISSFENNGNIECGIIHGFRSKKSPVTNAKLHVGFNYTLSMDLSNFFDSVRPHHVKGYIKDEVISMAFVDGSPKQGLPSSPAVCNLAAIKMDQAILKIIKKNRYHVIYTRYADDLSFSFNDHQLSTILLEKVKNIVSKSGFKINENKTRLQSAKFGNREVTGVMVGMDGITVSRRFKRRMRAAKHQNSDSYAGMYEWSKLKTPKEIPIANNQTQIDTRDKLVKHGKLTKNLKCRLDPLQEIRSGNFLITNDIAYICGMTDLSDGWTSCYREAGCNKNAPKFLSQFKVSVGLFLSQSEKEYYGVRRNKIKARCIIYHSTDNKMYALSFYGATEYTEKLKEFLKNNGVNLTVKKFQVVGYGKNLTKSSMYGGIKKVNTTLTGKTGKYIKLTF
jgi:galactitol-specific phosphotransferase system IIB component